MWLQLAVTAIKFPGRMESIPAETYFGSEQLFNTQIDDVKPFIANFTLPETGGDSTGINGTLEEVKEQMKRSQRQNRTVTSLVIYLTRANRRERTNSTSAYLLMDIDGTNFRHVKELWIFLPAPSLVETYWLVNLPLTSGTFTGILRLHIMHTGSPDDTGSIVFPEHFAELSSQLHVFHSNA